MSRLLQNILKNSNKQSLQEFDMSKSGSAMMRHFGSGFPYQHNDLPVEVESARWDQVTLSDKICLQRTYNLETSKFLLYFVNEVVHLSEEMHHHPEIIIKHTDRDWETYFVT